MNFYVSWKRFKDVDDSAENISCSTIFTLILTISPDKNNKLLTLNIFVTRVLAFIISLHLNMV